MWPTLAFLLKLKLLSADTKIICCFKEVSFYKIATRMFVTVVVSAFAMWSNRYYVKCITLACQWCDIYAVYSIELVSIYCCCSVCRHDAMTSCFLNGSCACFGPWHNLFCYLQICMRLHPAAVVIFYSKYEMSLTFVIVNACYCVGTCYLRNT